MVALGEQEETWLRFAQKGDVLASFNIGKFYAEKGENDEAKKWLKEAASKGHLGAIFKYGELLANLNETDEAKVWLKKASDKGHKMAQDMLSKL